MPVSYHLEPACEFIHTRMLGEVTPDEVRAHIDALLADPQLPARLFVLLDATALTVLPSTDTIRGAGNEIARLSVRVKLEAVCVVVVGIAAYGVFRMSQVLLERHFGPTHVSRDVESARDWLDARRAGSGPA